MISIEVHLSSKSIRDNSLPHHHPMHIHNALELLRVFKGTIAAQINNQEHIVSEGEIIVIFPNIAHSFSTVTKQEDTLFDILIYVPYFETNISNLINKCFLENPILQLSSLHPEVNYMISALHNEINGENNISIINAYFQLLWHRLMPNLHMKPLPLATISNMATIIITYISTHFQEPISLEILSDTFAVNKSYISRIFSQIFHISFPKYVNIIRVEHAKKLLLQSKVNITDIAIQCGYQNVPSFNRAFKNICGMTPSAYRQAPPL